MIEILKSIFEIIVTAFDKAVSARDTARRRKVGLILYRMQYNVLAIFETASQLQSQLSTNSCFPKTTAFPEDTSRNDPFANLLHKQGQNIAGLGKMVQRLIETGGDAPNVVPEHWQGVVPPQSRYRFVTETRDSILLGYAGRWERKCKRDDR